MKKLLIGLGIIMSLTSCDMYDNCNTNYFMEIDNYHVYDTRTNNVYYRTYLSYGYQSLCPMFDSNGKIMKHKNYIKGIYE